MLWLYMCFSDEAHIRVPTLRNHLLQNNAITKLFMDEVHLPPWQRLGMMKRLIRFLIYLLTIGTVTAQIATVGLIDIENKVNARTRCARSCMESHFPLLSCSSTLATVVADGQTYSNLYHYYRPELPYPVVNCVDSPLAELQLGKTCMEAYNDGECLTSQDVRTYCIGTCPDACDESAAAEQPDRHKRIESLTEAFTKVVRAPTATAGFSQLLTDIQTHVSGLGVYFGKLHPYELGREFAFCSYRAKYPWIDDIGDGMKERLHTCFSLCKEDDGDPRDTRRKCSDAGLDPYEHLICVTPDEPAPDPLERWGQRMCITERACASWLQLVLALLLVSIVQMVLELAMYQAAEVVESDGFWSGVNKCGLQLFITTVITIEVLLLVGPINVSQRMNRMGTMYFSMALAFIFDQAKNALTQPFIHRILVRQCGTVHPGIQEYNQEYISMWPTKPSLFEQLQQEVKGFLHHSRVRMLSMGIVMFYATLVLLQMLILPPYLPWIKENAVEFLTALTGLHYFMLTIFLFDVVLHSFAFGVEYLKDRWSLADNAVVFASIAMTAAGLSGRSVLLLRLIKPLRVLLVYRRKSDKRKKQKDLRDKSAVRVGSNVEKVLELIEELLSCKLLSQNHRDELEWIEQVVIDNKLYSVNVAQAENADMTGSSAEMNAWLLETMDIGVETSEKDTKKQKAEAAAPQLDGSGSARRPSLTQAGAGAASRMGGGASRMDGGAPVRGSRMAGRPAGSKMKGGGAGQSKMKGGAGQSKMGGGQSKMRQSRAGGQSRVRQSRSGGGGGNKGSRMSRMQQEEEEELKDSFLAQLYVLANVTQGEEAQSEQMLSNFDAWNIDLQPALDMVESNALAVIFCRCMMYHNLIPELKLDFELLFNACQHVQLASHPHVNFHSPAHACVMLHAVHYYLIHDLDRLMDPFEMFTLFFSCISVHYAHPGLTNEFLVKIRHPRALRYNDNAVLENYNLSRITMLLSDPECNFMLQMEALHIDAFRSLLINIILKMDMSKHFDQLSRLQTKLASDKYPTAETWMQIITKKERLPKPEEGEDRVILLFTALRCADLAWACKGMGPIFTRWADRFTEELFCQGDIEKQVGIPISAFSDRDLVQAPKAQLAFLHVIVAPILTQFIFTLREAEKGKTGVTKEVVDKMERELVDEGVEANRQALHNKVLQGSR